jgi:hypothetical protein
VPKGTAKDLAKEDTKYTVVLDSIVLFIWKRPKTIHSIDSKILTNDSSKEEPKRWGTMKCVLSNKPPFLENK